MPSPGNKQSTFRECFAYFIFSSSILNSNIQAVILSMKSSGAHQICRFSGICCKGYICLNTSGGTNKQENWEQNNFLKQGVNLRETMDKAACSNITWFVSLEAPITLWIACLSSSCYIHRSGLTFSHYIKPFSPHFAKALPFMEALNSQTEV